MSASLYLARPEEPTAPVAPAEAPVQLATDEHYRLSPGVAGRLADLPHDFLDAHWL